MKKMRSVGHTQLPAEDVARQDAAVAIDFRANAPGLRRERGIGLREFLEGKARNLGADVINARLEARGSFARDVVLEFVEHHVVR